jgi:hypothetical protein
MSVQLTVNMNHCNPMKFNIPVDFLFRKLV